MLHIDRIKNADVHKTDIAIGEQSDTNETYKHHTLDSYTER